MSTSEDVPLYPLDCVKEKEDGNHTRLTEPLEHDDTDSKQGTIPGAKGSSAAPATTNRWKTLMTAVTTLLAYVFLYAGISMIVPFYSIEAHQHNVATFIVGFVIGIAPLCVTVASPFIGYFLPHLGLKFTQLAGLFLAGGSLFLFGFVSMMPTPILFVIYSFLLRMVEGVGTAMCAAASYTQLTQFYPDKKGMVVSLVLLSVTVGFALGPPMGGGLQEAGGFVLPFLVVGGCIIIILLLLMVLIKPTECTSVKLPWRLVLKLLSNPIFVLLVVSLMLSFGTLDAGVAYFGQFLHTQFNLSVGIIGVIYLASTVTYAVCNILAGLMSDKLKIHRFLIIAGLVVASVGCLFIGPAKFIISSPLTYGNLSTVKFHLVYGVCELELWLSIVASAVFGAGMPFSIVPVYPEMYKIGTTIHESETAIVSTLSGIYIGSASAGQFLGPIIGGALVYKMGFRWMAAIFGFVLLVWALVLVIVTVAQRVWKSVTYRGHNRSSKQ